MPEADLCLHHRVCLLTLQPLRLIGGVDISFYPDPAAPAHTSTIASGEHETSASEAAAERGVAALVVLTYPVSTWTQLQVLKPEHAAHK